MHRARNHYTLLQNGNIGYYEDDIFFHYQFLVIRARKDMDSAWKSIRLAQTALSRSQVLAFQTLTSAEFLRRDGDHAISHRVLLFLLE